ncbi:MAG: outer membrane lipoprotein-sorting protein [Oceanococcus sp.]
MNRFMLRVSTVVLGLLATFMVGAASNPALQKADVARGKISGLEWQVDIESTVNGVSKGIESYRVLNSKGKSRVQGLAPRRVENMQILVLDGNMWTYRKGMKKPFPVARKQRLRGAASYGDIAATNYAEDYDATPLQDEQWQGVDCNVFMLKSHTPAKTTYDVIKYWVAKESGLGVRAEYFAVSGKLLASALMTYDNSIKIDGKAQPFLSQLIIQNEVIRSRVTTMNYSQPLRKETSPDMFDLDSFAQ